MAGASPWDFLFGGFLFVSWAVARRELRAAANSSAVPPASRDGTPRAAASRLAEFSFGEAAGRPAALAAAGSSAPAAQVDKAWLWSIFTFYPLLPLSFGNPQNWSHRHRECHEKMRNVAKIRMVRFSSNFGFR